MKSLFKAFFVFLLIGSVFFVSATKSILRVSYEINKLEIIQKFCVNKEVTTFKCDGKCYLKSQFKKVEQEEKGAPIIDTEKIQLFEVFFNKINLFPIFKCIQYNIVQKILESSYFSKILKPPIV